MRTGKDASRAGILDGLERLVAAIAADDAVVVYYSGHGGRIVRPDFAARKAAGLSVDYQFIVPFDLEQSEADDFRGITSEELTQFQRRLTDAFRSHGAVPNVTTILDCCHSGYMARNIDSRPKSIDVEQTVLRDAKSFRMLGISEHLQKLGREVELSGIVTNPDAVRMVACQPEESAYELASTRGGRHGAMTDALATVLDGLGDAAVPWAVVGDLVRRRVRALQPEQRPEVEGPSERLPFSAASAAASDALAITTIRGVSTVEAGELLGLAVGDELDIVAAADGERVGEATVKELAGGAAVLHVEGAAAAAIADGTAIAVPRNISVPKLFVHIGDVGQGADALRREIERSTRLAVTERPAEAIAGVGPGPAAGSVTLLDAAGAPWRATPFADDAAGRRELVDSLQALAVGHRLLDLSSGTGASSLGPVVDVQFGRVDTSGAAPTHAPLALHGERLKAGDTVHLAVCNTGPGAAVRVDLRRRRVGTLERAVEGGAQRVRPRGGRRGGRPLRVVGRRGRGVVLAARRAHRRPAGRASGDVRRAGGRPPGRPVEPQPTGGRGPRCARLGPRSDDRRGAHRDARSTGRGGH